MTRAVAIGLAVLLALAGARLTTSFTLLKTNPELAYRIDPGNPDVASALAEKRMFEAKGPADAERVKAIAIDALRGSPYLPSALRTVGFVVAVGQGEAEAEPILRAAGRGTLRDFLVHLWLFDKNYRENSVADAVREADIVLSQKHDRWDTIMPLLIGMLDDPRTIAPLAGALGRRPDWRGAFLEKMGLDLDNADSKFALLSRLKRQGQGASTAELRTYFLTAPETLTVPVLRARWLALTGNPESAGAFVHDGEFDGIDLPPPYVWRFWPNGDIYSEQQRREDGQGNALYVSFEGQQAVTFADQLLALKPGRYRLSGQVLGEDDTRGGQFNWRLTCGARGGRVIGQLPLVPRGPAWSRFAGEFDVPNECVGQMLSLTGVGVPGGRTASLWVDTIAITTVASR